MNTIIPKTLLLLLFALIANAIYGQDDHGLWASVSADQKLGKNWNLRLKPIYRLKNDFGDRQDPSIDLSVRRKFDKGWFAQVLIRQWMNIDAKDQTFFWLDLGRSDKIGEVKLNNRIRFHNPLVRDASRSTRFIRYAISASPKKWGKLQSSLFLEPWIGLGTDQAWQRIRIEPGLTYSLASSTKLTVKYRREEWLHSANDQNHWIINLGFML